jgi:hypothetical protein
VRASTAAGLHRLREDPQIGPDRAEKTLDRDGERSKGGTNLGESRIRKGGTNETVRQARSKGGTNPGEAGAAHQKSARELFAERISRPLDKGGTLSAHSQHMCSGNAPCLGLPLGGNLQGWDRISRDAGQSAIALAASAGDKLEPTPANNVGSDNSERYPGRGANGYVQWDVSLLVPSRPPYVALASGCESGRFWIPGMSHFGPAFAFPLTSPA